MRIVLHGGLHKSGTTFVQGAWRHAYGEPGIVWYPTPRGRLPGHQGLVRPLLRAFTHRVDPDLVRASLVAAGSNNRGPTLADVVDQAAASGAETLVLSAEDLDRVSSADAPALRAALGDHDVTLLLTVTRPAHRWCSGWQELVKHGLADYPSEAESHILRFAALEPGRVEQIVGLMGAARTVLRLVRTEPPEPALAADLAGAVGLPDPGSSSVSAGRNISVGTDIEVVRRINRADLALGTSRAGLAVLAELRGDGFTYADRPSLADSYRLTESFARGAATERDFLERLVGREDIRLLDPHQLLPTWLDPTPPDWYATISRREAVLPALDDLPESSEEDWRARQERAAQAALSRRGAP